MHRVPVLPKVCMLFVFLCYNCSVPYRARIGRGTFFNHGGMGVLINPMVEIGEDCKIGNNVSIVGQGPYKNAPKLGNRIYIGPGAVIQGPVIIEDDVIIAPNSVVNKSVHSNMIVAGVPARIIGDKRLLDYDIFRDDIFREGFKPYLKE